MSVSQSQAARILWLEERVKELEKEVEELKAALAQQIKFRKLGY